MHALIFRE